MFCERPTVSEISSFRPIIDFLRHAHSDELLFTTRPAQGDHRSFIVEAAKQRDLTVKNLGRDHIAFLDGGRAIGGMYKTVTSLVSHAALSVTNSKKLTKEIFSAAQLPVPVGRSFTPDHFDEALTYFQNRRVPVVVKPVTSRSATGITTNVKSPDEFRVAWTRAVKAATGKNGVIVEHFVTGLNIRAFVVTDRVVAAVARVPAFIVGNGQDSLGTLIEAKTALRAEHPYLQRLPMQVDTDCPDEQNLTYTSIPEAGAPVLLNDSVVIKQGGEPIDVTTMLSPELQELAVRAALAIPGLTVAGIDLIAASPSSTDEAVVLQANAAANISLHHIPAYGKSVDVAGAIIEQMMLSSPRPPVKERPPKGKRIPWKGGSQRVSDRISKSFNPRPRPSY